MKLFQCNILKPQYMQIYPLTQGENNITRLENYYVTFVIICKSFIILQPLSLSMINVVALSKERHLIVTYA